MLVVCDIYLLMTVPHPPSPCSFPLDMFFLPSVEFPSILHPPLLSKLPFVSKYRLTYHNPREWESKAKRFASQITSPLLRTMLNLNLEGFACCYAVVVCYSPFFFSCFSKMIEYEIQFVFHLKVVFCVLLFSVFSFVKRLLVFFVRTCSVWCCSGWKGKVSYECDCIPRLKLLM